MEIKLYDLKILQAWPCLSPGQIFCDTRYQVTLVSKVTPKQTN